MCYRRQKTTKSKLKYDFVFAPSASLDSVDSFKVLTAVLGC